MLGDVHKSHFDGVQRMIAWLGWVVREGETGRDYGQLSGNVYYKPEQSYGSVIEGVWVSPS